MRKINNTDVVWSFFATFFKAASGVLLLPFILKMLPTEEVGLWTIFMSVTLLVNLLDFGFSTSFTRNISYIFSGAKQLESNGIPQHVDTGKVDYKLLRSTVDSMRWFYRRISILVLLFLSIPGTVYIGYVLKSYTGDRTEAFIAWFILCIINTYSLYTFYYDSLLVGRGYVKQSKKIIVFSQVVFLILAVILLKLDYGITAIVASQLVYVLIARSLSKKVFFDKEMSLSLKNADNTGKKEVFKAVYPNAVKLGFTALGGILVQRSAIFIGSLYLPLSDIASYGLTRQIFDIISGLAPIYISTYYPMIANYRLGGNIRDIRKIYINGTLLSFLIFIPVAIIVYYYGNTVLELIGSGTMLVNRGIIIAAALLSFIEMNHITAAGILLTKNQVPFFKPSIISGIATAILIYAFLVWTDIGLLGLFLAPGIVDVAYQSWKWPLEVFRELKISLKDFKPGIFRF